MILCRQAFFQILSMQKKILLVLLLIALALEAWITYLCFFDPATAFKAMKVNYRADLAFPAYLIGWFLLLVMLLIGYTLYAVTKNQRQVAPLIYILALWWIGIGIGIWGNNGTVNNLLSDSLKGLLLLIVTPLWVREKT